MKNLTDVAVVDAYVAFQRGRPVIAAADAILARTRRLSAFYATETGAGARGAAAGQ